MKKSFLIAIASLLAGCVTAQTEQDYTIAASAALKDGSSVKGEFVTQSITGSTAFMEKLELDPALVKTIAFANTNGESKVELNNGDRFAMKVANESFAIKSILGELNIPRNNFRALSVSAHKVSATGNDDGLVFYCTFDDEAAIASPVVGPIGECFATTFQDGKSGKALLCPAYVSCASFLFPENFLGTAGCIEFWAMLKKTHSRVGWGGDPRLFTLSRDCASSTFGTLDIVSNNGAGNSGFATWTLLGNTASIYGMPSGLTYDDIYPNGKWQGWHHYAISWDSEGIPGLDANRTIALYIDGNLTPAVKTDYRSIEEVRSIVTGKIRLSFSGNSKEKSEHNTKSPFLIDEFKIWNHAKTNFEL